MKARGWGEYRTERMVLEKCEEQEPLGERGNEGAAQNRISLEDIEVVWRYHDIHVENHLAAQMLQREQDEFSTDELLERVEKEYGDKGTGVPS